VLQNAVKLSSGSLRLISGLIDHGADVHRKDDNGRSLISLAVKSGNIGVIKLLIISGCKIEINNRVLHDAAEINRSDIMEVLHAKFAINVNSVDEQGTNPVHIAATRNYPDVIKFCVSIGGDTDILDGNGSSPLHLASEKGHLEAVECLLNHSTFGKYQLNKQGKTSFTIAAENNHAHLYDILQLGDVMLRAARVDDSRGIRTCLTDGGNVNVNRKDQYGWTPLHRAAFKGRVESVKVLISGGAEIDALDYDGVTPLHCCVEAGHVQVALLLIAHGANVKSIKGVIPWNLNCPEKAILPLCCEKKERV
jgi:ankyrin repeat protein